MLSVAVIIKTYIDDDTDLLLTGWGEVDSAFTITSVVPAGNLGRDLQMINHMPDLPWAGFGVFSSGSTESVADSPCVLESAYLR